MRTKNNKWVLWERNEIPDVSSDQTYLRRWRIIETPWGGIYLHHILLPDGDLALHDHPFRFAALILRGGYREVRQRIYGPLKPSRRLYGRRQWRWHGWLSLNGMGMEDAHKITSVKPNTWTLVLRGRRMREWGFYEPLADNPGEQYSVATRWQPFFAYDANPRRASPSHRHTG